jgi:hypothetical protein
LLHFSRQLLKRDIVLGLALYVGQSQITMRYEASMSSLLQESSKALLHLTEVFQKVRNTFRTRVSDPDLYWIRIQSGPWNRIRIPKAKMTHKNRKKSRNFMF